MFIATNQRLEVTERDLRSSHRADPALLLQRLQQPGARHHPRRRDAHTRVRFLPVHAWVPAALHSTALHLQYRCYRFQWQLTRAYNSGERCTSTRGYDGAATIPFLVRLLVDGFTARILVSALSCACPGAPRAVL